MLRKIRKLILHPNRYFYDYFRKKMGFRKYFVTDKIRLLDSSNHQKWHKALFSHPYLYLYYKFNKRLRKPLYPILIDYRIENIEKSGMGGGKRVVLAVELERNNIIYFADPEIVLKVLYNREPNLTGKIFKFRFNGSRNRVYIGSNVRFGRFFKAVFKGNGNCIEFQSGNRCSGGTIEFNGNKNTLSILDNTVIMTDAGINFLQDHNYAHIGPNSRIFPQARLIFCGNNAVAYFRGHQNIRQSISLTMGSIFFHGGCSNNISNVRHSYLALEGKNILIGSDTMFAVNLLIRTSDTHLIYDRMSQKRTNTGKSIIIGDHVWIGQDNMIFKGAVIEDGCMVGARSIVTGHIAANCICAGSPARVKKENIIWDRTMPQNFTKIELEDYETYKPIVNEYEPVGHERLLKINAIDSELKAKVKVKYIEKILKS